MAIYLYRHYGKWEEYMKVAPVMINVSDDCGDFFKDFFKTNGTYFVNNILIMLYNIQFSPKICKIITILSVIFLLTKFMNFNKIIFLKFH